LHLRQCAAEEFCRHSRTPRGLASSAGCRVRWRCRILRRGVRPTVEDVLALRLQRRDLMSEVLFYHLERRGLDDVLPGLVERTLERGWRALIRTESAERADAIDALLWTYNDQTFLPHAIAGDGDSARQPVLISVEQANVNKANVMFLVGGAEPPAWDGTAALTRIV